MTILETSGKIPKHTACRLELLMYVPTVKVALNTETVHIVKVTSKTETVYMLQ